MWFVHSSRSHINALDAQKQHSQPLDKCCLCIASKLRLTHEFREKPLTFESFPLLQCQICECLRNQDRWWKKYTIIYLNMPNRVVTHGQCSNQYTQNRIHLLFVLDAFSLTLAEKKHWLVQPKMDCDCFVCGQSPTLFVTTWFSPRRVTVLQNMLDGKEACCSRTTHNWRYSIRAHTSTLHFRKSILLIIYIWHAFW